MLCFSISDLESYNNILNKWYSEVRSVCPQVPVVLVGCKCDTRDRSETEGGFKVTNQVSKEQGLSMKSIINAEKYIGTLKVKKHSPLF
jgi:GTPase SAR1 family protein